MKRKRNLLILLSVLGCLVAMAQPKREIDLQFGRMIEFQFKTAATQNDIRGTGTCQLAINDTSLWEILKQQSPAHKGHAMPFVPESPIMLGVKLNAATTDRRPRELHVMDKIVRSYLISNRSEVIVLALGINKNNVKDFRYRVVEDDTVERVHWSAIPSLQQKYGARQPYGFIGTFKSLNKKLFIEVVNVHDYGVREGVMFDWHENLRPVIKDIVIYLPGKFTAGRGGALKPLPNIFSINDQARNKAMATRFNKKLNIPLNLHFYPDSILSLNINLSGHPTVNYDIFLLQKDKSNKVMRLEYGLDEDTYNIPGHVFRTPGKYEIIIQRSGKQPGEWPENQVIRIPVEVKQPPFGEVQFSLREMFPYIVIVFNVFVLALVLLRRRSKLRLRRTEREKQMASLKLQSIRSQLNPHFLFNALTSIQNLVNQNDVEGANKYLGKFAGLTRQVLTTGSSELISLDDELRLIDDYLQMEQLRFGFEYDIKVDTSINTANTEIPAMLLQPFLENATKHGVSALHGEGKINVDIGRQENNLILTVTDNGGGMGKTSHTGNGMGLKLTKERMVLLSELYKEQPISYNINSADAGTIVIVTLTNWIS